MKTDDPCGKAGSRGKLLYVAVSLKPPGGGQSVGAWALQALRKDWQITVLCADLPDFASLNRHFGTRLNPGDFTILRAPWLIRHVHRIDPDRNSFQRAAWLMRMCRRLSEDFDVILGTDNEMDFGRPGILYVHYPYLIKHEHEVNTVRSLTRMQRIGAFLTGRYRLWVLTSKLTFDGVNSNLMLVNSQWSAGVVSGHYHNRPVVLYPPVPWSRAPLPWNQQSLSFATIGRIEEGKRQIEAIDILQRVRERGHDLTLDIIGDIFDACYARKLQARARAAGPWVRLHHGVARGELEDIVSGCRYGLHMMPNEHFGIAVAELVRAGCVVFLPNSGGQTEIVANEAALMYSNDNEAVERICRVLGDATEQLRLREYLATRRSLYNEHRYMRELRAIVRNFAAKQGS